MTYGSVSWISRAPRRGLVKVAEQAALELVKVAWLLTGPEVAYESDDTSETGLLGWVIHDR